MIWCQCMAVATLIVVTRWCNHKGMRLMTQIALVLSHHHEHKFILNFQNCINPLCSCDMDIESTFHNFIQCLLFDDKRITFLSTPRKIDCKLIEINVSSLTDNSMLDMKKIPLSHFINWKIQRTVTLTCLKNYH